MKITAIHRTEAMRLLRDGEWHKVQVWTKDGGIRVYPAAKYKGGGIRARSTRVELAGSCCIRQFRDVTLHKIDDLDIYW